MRERETNSEKMGECGNIRGRKCVRVYPSTPQVTKCLSRIHRQRGLLGTTWCMHVYVTVQDKITSSGAVKTVMFTRGLYLDQTVPVTALSYDAFVLFIQGGIRSYGK